MPEPRLSPVLPPERPTELNLVKGISEGLTSIPSPQTGADRGLAGVIEDLIRLVKETWGLASFPCRSA